MQRFQRKFKTSDIKTWKHFCNGHSKKQNTALLIQCSWQRNKSKQWLSRVASGPVNARADELRAKIKKNSSLLLAKTFWWLTFLSHNQCQHSLIKRITWRLWKKTYQNKAQKIIFKILLYHNHTLDYFAHESKKKNWYDEKSAFFLNLKIFKLFTFCFS